METSPATRYARTNDGVHIAYQVVGDGPIDLVLVASGLGLGQIWRALRTGSFLERLASFSRLILLDRRGTGLSDHILDREQQLTLESRMEDVRAVMDAAGSSRAALLGLDPSGGSVAVMFAATLPDALEDRYRRQTAQGRRGSFRAYHRTKARPTRREP